VPNPKTRQTDKVRSQMRSATGFNHLRRATARSSKDHRMTLDVKKIRADFPILQRKIGECPLVYLDNAATSQKPRQVIDALTGYYTHYNANVHRGVHTLSIEATDAFEAARTKVARFIGATNPESIIWTRNISEAINLVAYSWGDANVSAGDEIVITAMEHHSGIVPWQQLAERSGAILKIIPRTEDGRLNVDAAERLMNGKTKIVAAVQMSSVLGTIIDVKAIGKLAHNNGALMLVDGAQSAPHMPVDVEDLNCDFFGLSAHKMLGPTGIGVLYGRPEILEAMPPWMFGGDMILAVSYEDASWNDLPYKFEAGTPNIADAIATGAAVDYLSEIGMENVRAHEIELTGYALSRFAELESVKILGPLENEDRGGIISFVHDTIHPHDLGTALDRMGIAIRTGHHCAMPLVRSYGVVAAARASFYIYNTHSEVDKLIEGIKQTERYFLK
jgi:cysteine desulfurase/selenocysteine lyase